MTLILVLWTIWFINAVLSLLLVPRLRADGAWCLVPGAGLLDRTRHQAPGTLPLVSIIVPARNEARIIAESVRSFLAQDYELLEVVVVNDRSTDATGEILHSIDDPRLVVIDGLEPPPGWLGKPWALTEGSRAARGDVLLFVDADVIYAPALVSAAVERLEGGNASLITFFPHFELHGFWEHLALPQLLFTAYAVVPAWLSNRTTNRYMSLAGGPGIMIQREIYDEVGGHEKLRAEVVDDIGLARLVRMAGHRTEGVRADDLVSLRMYHGGREIFDGFTKNLFAAFGHSYIVASLFFTAGVACNILPYVLLFVTAGFVQWLSVGVIALITLTRLVLFVPFRYGVVNALLGHPLMFAFWTAIYIRSLWQTGVRRETRWRGRTYGRF